jgi:hypothetical protein
LLQPWKLREVARVPGVTQAGGAEVPLERDRRPDVGDDKVKAPGRAGRDRRDVRAELNRTPRAGRCELDAPEAVIEREVRIEPPPEAPVELLRAIDIRDGDDDRLELQVDVLDARDPCSCRRSGHPSWSSRPPWVVSGMTVALSPLRRTRHTPWSASSAGPVPRCTFMLVPAGRGRSARHRCRHTRWTRGCAKRSQIDSALPSSFPAVGPEWTGQVTVASTELDPVARTPTVWGQ